MAFLREYVERLVGRMYFGPKSDISKAVPKERKKNAPKPLPSLRPRALSLPNRGDEGGLSIPSTHITTRNENIRLKKQQYFYDQKQSGLVGKLPQEIRLQIWRYCVASFEIHIVRGKNKLVAIPCLGQEEEARMPPCQHKYWGSSTKAIWGYYGVCPGYFYDSNGCPPLSNPVPLLQSCRVIYSEAIDLLYSENSFHINHIDTIISLSRTVLPSRLNLIRTLHLAYTFPMGMYTEGNQAIPPYDANTWKEACRIIASMTGLKILYIHLGGSHLRFELHDILRPLHQIRQADTFDVFVGIGCDPENVYMVEKPFRFVFQHYNLLQDWECC